MRVSIDRLLGGSSQTEVSEFEWEALTTAPRDGWVGAFENCHCLSIRINRFHIGALQEQ
jgi:hypothetical protein